jgi:hypothetical protein
MEGLLSVQSFNERIELQALAARQGTANETHPASGVPD